ncbi:Histone chaperonr [Candida tropicalis]
MGTDWISQLPSELQEQINAVVQKDESSLEVFCNLHDYLKSGVVKRRKISEETQVIPPETIIFEINQISFVSPVRKRMNLTLHLIQDGETATPALSIVNPANNISEHTFTDLKDAIKLCAFLPVLGNTTNPSKRGVCYLCCWMHDDFYPEDSNASRDPIVCQLNLDLIKKQKVKNGELPADFESQFFHPKNSVILDPVQERIIDHFQRQFKMCGISVINYLPATSLFKNTYSLNNDDALSLTIEGSETPALVMVDCYKGAKDGVLMFLEDNSVNPAYIIFGFKKPILVYPITRVIRASYSNITRSTFNLNISVLNSKDEQRHLEFSMISEKYYQMIDGFIKSHDITDSSFTNDGHELTKTESIEELAVVGEFKPGIPPEDDDEDDEDFNGGVSDSDVDEEYDSDVQSDNDGDAAASDVSEEEEEEDGVFSKSKENE